MLQVYTGDGKGKTTAAFGLALRAAGHGWPVLIVQFMKGDSSYGEVQAARHIPGLEVRQFGLPTFVEMGNPQPEDIEQARKGIAAAHEALVSRKYRMLILDELNVAVDYGLVRFSEVLTIVDNCPVEVELVITGRGARRELLERADLVSEVRCIKHPFDRGIVNRVGIDH
ncbi:MAG: cob(I)yrinic acid a,c-diamide adenosyltransferase [candidate division WOR-3 bacterium]